jgi:cytidylate kinase
MQAKDAIVIDSTHLTMHEVADKILSHIRSNGQRRKK